MIFHVPPVKQFQCTAQSNGQAYRITVMPPVCSVDNTETFPVLYILDSNEGVAFQEIIRNLHFGATPRFITVGIGYDLPNAYSAGQLRGRDFTPYALEEIDSLEALPVVGADFKMLSKKSGGADAFLAFLRDQLIPRIDDEFPTRSEDRALFGFSAAASFAIFSMFAEPDLFTRIIAGSPPIARDRLIPVARDYCSYHDVLNVNLFLGLGSLENDEPQFEKHRLAYHLNALLELLKSSSLKGLSVSSQEFDNECHVSSMGMSFIRGVQSVFGKADDDDLFIKAISGKLG